MERQKGGPAPEHSASEVIAPVPSGHRNAGKLQHEIDSGRTERGAVICAAEQSPPMAD
jgi:hypothetical protein